MLGNCRIVAYGIAIAISTVLSILSTYDRVDEVAQHFHEQAPLSPATQTLSLESNPNNLEPKILAPKPVIAPWTKLMEIDGHTYPRSFVFSEVRKLDDYGLKLRTYDESHRKKVQSLMEDRLCKRAGKFAATKYDANKCNQGIDLLKCSSCSELDGSWYTMSSVTGAVFGKAEQTASLRFPFYNDGPFAYQQLDIAVPISGQDAKLKTFALHLGSSIKKFRQGLLGSRIAIRLLITRFQNEHFENQQAMEEFQSELIRRAELDRPGDSVEFVAVEEPSFSRAKAVNVLHSVACHNDDCVLACTDVDMNINSRFLRNALLFPFPGAAAYFPIMWSEFSPDTVHLVDKFLTESAQWKYTDHHVSLFLDLHNAKAIQSHIPCSIFSFIYCGIISKGYWRKSSYGMYAIAGSDAKRLSMDEKFVGWGGEVSSTCAQSWSWIIVIGELSS